MTGNPEAKCKNKHVFELDEDNVKLNASGTVFMAKCPEPGCGMSVAISDEKAGKVFGMTVDEVKDYKKQLKAANNNKPKPRPPAEMPKKEPLVSIEDDDDNDITVSSMMGMGSNNSTPPQSADFIGAVDSILAQMKSNPSAADNMVSQENGMIEIKNKPLQNEPEEPNDILKAIIDKQSIDQESKDDLKEMIDYKVGGWEPFALEQLLGAYGVGQAIAKKIMAAYQAKLFKMNMRQDRENKLLSMFDGMSSASLPRKDIFNGGVTLPKRDPADLMGRFASSPQNPVQQIERPQTPTNPLYGQPQYPQPTPAQQYMQPPQPPQQPWNPYALPNQQQGINRSDVKNMISDELKGLKDMLVQQQYQQQIAMLQQQQQQQQQNNPQNDMLMAVLLEMIKSQQQHTPQTTIADQLLPTLIDKISGKQQEENQMLMGQIAGMIGDLKKANDSHPTSIEEWKQMIEFQKLLAEMNAKTQELEDRAETRDILKTVAQNGFKAVTETVGMSLLNRSSQGGSQHNESPVSNVRAEPPRQPNPQPSKPAAQEVHHDVPMTQYGEEGLSNVQCQRCGSNIVVPAGATRVTCPNRQCNAVWEVQYEDDEEEGIEPYERTTDRPIPPMPEGTPQDQIDQVYQMVDNMSDEEYAQFIEKVNELQNGGQMPAQNEVQEMSSEEYGGYGNPLTHRIGGVL